MPLDLLNKIEIYFETYEVSNDIIIQFRSIDVKSVSWILRRRPCGRTFVRDERTRGIRRYVAFLSALSLTGLLNTWMIGYQLAVVIRWY